MYFFRTACFSYICVADFRCRFLRSLAPKMLKSPGPAPPEKYANRRIPNENRKCKKTIVIHKAVGRFSGRHHKLNTIAKTAIPKTTGFSKKCFAGTWHFSKISGKTFFPTHHSKTVAGGSSSRGGRPAGPKFKKTPKSGFVIFRGAPCSVLEPIDKRLAPERTDPLRPLRGASALRPLRGASRCATINKKTVFSPLLFFFFLFLFSLMAEPRFFLRFRVWALKGAMNLRESFGIFWNL